MNGITGKTVFMFCLPALLLFVSCTPKLSPQRPALEQSDFQLDSLPDSEINIPVKVNLQPLYALAEKNIDTVYTSPNYPSDWLQQGCGVRYKYHFRRGPLQLKAAGTVLNLGFTGYYQVIGSTRACVNGTVLSPWTPPCHCGFDEGERKVTVNFSNSLFLTPDYQVKLNIQRLEPQAVDKCQVCFWGQDITAQVMLGLKEQLDTAKATIEKRYGSTDLRSRFQQLWNQLTQVYPVSGLGWLHINPLKLRINNIYAKNDSLNINLGLAARPAISPEKPREEISTVPDLADFSDRPGFNIFLDAQLDYDSLSNLVNARLQDKVFDFSKGPIKKHVIVQQCRLYGEGNEKLIIRVDFAGSYEGVAYFTGKPYFDEQANTIEIRDLDFDVKTRDVLLKSARWLFSKKITGELKKYSRFELGAYIDTAKTMINGQLNKEWVKGISSYGQIEHIRLIGIYPLSRHLVIRSNCSGNLAVVVNSVDFSF
ncbi:MAG TPA: DUF4403 family protein [Chitinophagaceae bacterium]|jgi:hypothetical protein|nr:DUF4403 family protein [Chitinophagaceae bacterium]